MYLAIQISDPINLRRELLGRPAKIVSPLTKNWRLWQEELEENPSEVPQAVGARLRYSTTILHQTPPLLINDNTGIIRFYSYLFLLSQARNLLHIFLLHYVWAILFSLRHCYTLLP